MMQPTPQRPSAQQQPQYAQQPYPPNQYPQQPYPMQQAPQYIQYPPQQPPAVPAPRSTFKNILVLLVGCLAGVYLMWPSLVPDFVPDVLPLIGQLDDNTAMLVILSCFRYFGVDLTNIFLGWQRLRGR